MTQQSHLANTTEEISVTEEQFNTMEQIVRGATGVHRSIASSAFPQGVTLSCTHPLCAHQRHATREEAAKFLASGWPKHCDRTMRAEPTP